MSQPVFMPVLKDGGQTIMRISGPGTRLARATEDEERRIRRIQRNRRYFHGTQFDDTNAAELDRLRKDPDNPLPLDKPLPEHRRLHAYSTQIAECVEMIANQLCDGFQFVASSDQVQTVIDQTIDATDVLKNGSDEDVSFDDLLVDAGQAGDVAYEVLWDPVRQTTYWEFWEAEQVEFHVPTGQWVQQVIRKQFIVVDDDREGLTTEREVEEIVIYDLVTPPEGDRRECRRRVYWDTVSDESKRGTDEFLGLPVIPWGVLKADKRGLRGFRGDPLIRRNAIANADRYNANEQVAYLIGRYNSHGNIAVTGDQSFIQLQQDPILGKDIADVLRFPGGTSVSAITLPTDAQMLTHTHNVTSDAIYASFGLVRVEPDTLGGLGGVSGYALEILNRKSEGTFRRIRRTWKTDCVGMVNLTVDVYAYRSGAVLSDDVLQQLYEDNPELDVPAGALLEVPWWDVDPMLIYPDREVEIRMGSGYIVDDVQVRDDFTAKLISREEALRVRGKSPDQIKEIVKEINDSTQAQTEGTLQSKGVAGFPLVTQAGSTVDIATQQANGVAVPNGVQAGSATGSTRRQ